MIYDGCKILHNGLVEAVSRNLILGVNTDQQM